MVECAEESVLGHKEGRGAVANTPFNLERAIKSAWGNSCALTKSRQSLWAFVLTQGTPVWIKVEDWGHPSSQSVKTNSSSNRGEAWKQSYYQHPAFLKSLPNSPRIRSMWTKTITALYEKKVKRQLLQQHTPNKWALLCFLGADMRLAQFGSTPKHQPGIFF